MISSLTALFIIFAAVIGSTAMIGIFSYFLNRIRQLEAKSSGDAGSDRLAGQMDAVREELMTLQNEMSALSERVDFTEKLLTSGERAAPGDDAQ